MKTRRWLAFPLLMIVVFIPVYAQQPTEQEMKTFGLITEHSRYGWANGKAWKILDRQSKVIYVEGIENGIFLFFRESYPKLSTADRAVSETETDNLLVTGFRMSDIVDQVDVFYSDSSNLRIPMADAYKYSMKKMHGAKEPELQDYTSELRAIYNK